MSFVLLFSHGHSLSIWRISITISYWSFGEKIVGYPSRYQTIIREECRRKGNVFVTLASYQNMSIAFHDELSPRIDVWLHAVRLFRFRSNEMDNRIGSHSWPGTTLWSEHAINTCADEKSSPRHNVTIEFAMGVVLARASICTARFANETSHCNARINVLPNSNVPCWRWNQNSKTSLQILADLPIGSLPARIGPERYSSAHS